MGPRSRGQQRMRGRRGAVAVLGAVALLAPASCRREPPPPAAHPHYFVPGPWQGEGGVWFYPAERFGGDVTGLAVPTSRARGTLTADGEDFTPDAAVAAVQNLQLPCILRVTDLADGRQILVRANDLGPGAPGRLIALSPHARTLLGMGDAPTPVRVEIEGGLSQDLAASLGSGPHLDVTAAPIGDVAEAPLPAPGAGPAPAMQRATGTPAPRAASATAIPALPDRVWQVPVGPRSLVLDAGRFSGADAAASVAERIGGQVTTEGEGRDVSYRVTRGPFTSIGAADDALDQAARAGISGVRIVIE